MGSTPKETTQTTKTEPWAGAKPYLLKTYGIADQLVDAGVPNYYPGQTVIDQSQATMDALAQMEATARQGSVMNKVGEAVTTNVAAGNMFDQSGQNTNKALMGGINLGTNPAAAGVAGFLADKTPAPGTNTLQQGMGYTNGALAGAQSLANSNAVNPAMQGFAQGQGYTNAGLGLQGALAGGLAGARNPGSDLLSSTASGAYLNANPYLNEAIASSNRGLIDQFQTEVAPGIDSQFARSGRMGSGAFAAARNKAEGSLANAMTQNANSIAMQNYQGERQNQLAAQNQIGANYNSDVSNQMQANAGLSATSDAQQAQRLAATQGVGNTYNSDFTNKLNATQLSGQLDAGQNDARMNAANSANSQFNAGRDQTLRGLGLQSDVYNTGVQNELNNANLKLNAASAFNGTQNNNIAQQMGAIAQMPTVNDLRYSDASRLAQVGSARDSYNDLLLQAEIAKWDQNQNKQWDNVARATALYTGGGYNTATTTKPVYQDKLGQVLGAASSIAGIAGMFCDARLKINVKRIGQTDAGVPLYSFEYTHAPGKTHIGPIAQEVITLQPEAVIELPTGVLMIDMETLH